ncbi:predicted protein [Plenodomus lingam JN3]|uniref:Uncharacterized protein n=1 Tax=Leptosphaeria maculans (strain JN3 / isolate v23.1.3 / race Av1-4-5-6-7-8) TaxID=985895 RepID=E5A5Z0_LEPMJ|nr:predicted protein [Plenodomus lingam JN3]CBX99035.1 predicted protein [Plenodomus lingam JN3]
MLPWPRLRNSQPALDQLHHAAWSESLIWRVKQRGTSHAALSCNPACVLRSICSLAVRFRCRLSRAARLLDGCTLDGCCTLPFSVDFDSASVIAKLNSLFVSNR